MVMQADGPTDEPRNETLAGQFTRTEKWAIRRATARRGRHCGRSISAVLRNLICPRKLAQLLKDDADIQSSRNN